MTRVKWPSADKARRLFSLAASALLSAVLPGIFFAALGI